MRRNLIAVALGLLLTFMLSSAALAHHCTNANKKVGAGSVAHLVLDENFDFVSYEITSPSGMEVNPGQAKKGEEGRAVGGFITISVLGGPSVDIFVQNTLPAGAMNAGPGDDLCDGKGIDDALACLGFYG
jgi:hypothetical protein